jgi:hypothetical protein
LLKFKFSDTRFLISFIAVAVLILVGAIAALWFWFFRRMRKDEKELDNVEEYLHLDLEDGKPDEDTAKTDLDLPDHLKPK